MGKPKQNVIKSYYKEDFPPKNILSHHTEYCLSLKTLWLEQWIFQQYLFWKKNKFKKGKLHNYPLGTKK